MTDFMVNRIDKDSSSVTHGMWLRFGARLRVAKLRPLHRARHKQSICLQQLICASIPFLYSPSRLYQRNFIIFDEWCQLQTFTNATKLPRIDQWCKTDQILKIKTNSPCARPNIGPIWSSSHLAKESWEFTNSCNMIFCDMAAVMLANLWSSGICQ